MDKIRNHLRYLIREAGTEFLEFESAYWSSGHEWGGELDDKMLLARSGVDKTLVSSRVQGLKRHFKVIALMQQNVSLKNKFRHEYSA
jgi:hypothetical protein